jgi:hypothetical protein
LAQQGIRVQSDRSDQGIELFCREFSGLLSVVCLLLLLLARGEWCVSWDK